jgi:hypothetical protein
MNRYSIDYSSPQPHRRPSARRLDRRMWAQIRRATLLLCGLACGIALVGWFRLDMTKQQLQRANDQHRLRYDSLLANKLETERQLIQLRQRLDSLGQGQDLPPPQE